MLVAIVIKYITLSIKYYSFWVGGIYKFTLQKKWSFPLRISSLNVTKWKTSFFVKYYSWPFSISQLMFSRSSLQEMFCREGVLKNFAKFVREHLCQGLFFNVLFLSHIETNGFKNIQEKGFQLTHFRTIFLFYTPWKHQGG